MLNHVKDYFKQCATNLGRGELPSARTAAEDFVSRCAEVAANMEAQE